ncbi:hypothetical protein BDR06DRAFT_1061219, partial [Suillus hirtellus]
YISSNVLLKLPYTLSRYRLCSFAIIYPSLLPLEIMYQHLGLCIGLDSDAAGASSSAQESSAASASSSNAPGPSRPHPTSNPTSGSRAAQSLRPTSNQQQSSAVAPQPSSSNQQAAAHPQTNPATAHQGNPATQQQAHPTVQTSSNNAPPTPGNAAQPQVANELAVLRARIAELERLEAQGNPNLARAPAPQQALVGDPATIECVCATIAAPKEDSKWPTLPALQPGHKVSALSMREFSLPRIHLSSPIYTILFFVTILYHFSSPHRTASLKGLTLLVSLLFYCSTALLESRLTMLCC